MGTHPILFGTVIDTEEQEGIGIAPAGFTDLRFSRPLLDANQNFL